MRIEKDSKAPPPTLKYSYPVDVCRTWWFVEASKRVVRTEISRIDDLNRRKAGAGHDRVEWKMRKN